MSWKMLQLLLLGLFVSPFVHASERASPADDLDRGFVTPPPSAQPRVWWHWMNGNVSKAGITADLEWMKRVGIGGMQMFDGSLGVPQFTDERLVWMSAPWREALRHAASEAERLGLEMSMAASGGWSESGGPMVTPAEGMKKLVWSETAVRGPRRLRTRLPLPPAAAGPFQGIPRTPLYEVPAVPLPGAKAPPPAGPDGTAPSFVADAAVIAYRLPAREESMAALHPKFSADRVVPGAEALTDGNLMTTALVSLPQPGAQTWLQWEFPRGYRAHALSLAVEAGQFEMRLPRGEIQASDDGVRFEKIAAFAGPAHAFANGVPVRTFAFPPHTARFFRVVFAPLPQKSVLVAALGYPPYLPELRIREVELVGGARVHRWEDKAGFGVARGDLGADPTPTVDPADAIRPDQVIDLSARMRADGTLDWQVPPGEWRILRLGYSLTGQHNGPATPEATGLEVDKLSREHVASYLGQYVDQVADTLGPLFGRSFRYFLMDSWEAGAENWTDRMAAEFRARRGYDPTPYLPVLLGRVVSSAETSEGFLWDFRRTLADLLAENHYRAAADYFRGRGVGLYAEAMGTGQPAVGDGLLNKGQVDIPMGEFWATLPGRSPDPAHVADVRETASAAHIYGKPIAAAESFTSDPTVPAWGQSPFVLKPLADRALAMGINRFVIHTSAHQPFVDQAHKPGLTLYVFGQHYTRNNTWAEQAVAWNTYLARCSQLLQQGLFVGDVAYYYGDGAPATVPFWRELEPAAPDGYSYDFVNQDVLLRRMTVRDGRLVLPDGMSYAVLVFPADLDRLTLATLRRLRELVSQGAVVMARRPVGSPSLGESLAAGDEFRRMADELWGTDAAVTDHPFGRGRVVWGPSVAQLLAASAIPPDLELTQRATDSSVVWIHRRMPQAEIYFVANQKDRAEDLEVRLRVADRDVELWHPDTGAIDAGDYQITDGRTRVPLHLDPYGSVFVVLRHAAASRTRTVARPAEAALTGVEGPWRLRFPPDLGAPPEITLPALASWTVNADPGVRYFSGSATYEKDLEVPASWLRPDARLVLDLGSVREIAEVSVNGTPVGGILWKPPFRADITAALKPGRNHVAIRVTNLWPNRMIGDQQPGEHARYTFTDILPYRRDSRLLESGLLGPVRLSRSTTP